MSKDIYNTLPAWKKQLIDNPSDYIQSMFELDEWFDIVVNELEEANCEGPNNGFYGKTHSEETKALLSKIRMGKTPWNKDKKGLQKHSKETKTQMSEDRKGNKNAFYNKTHTEESKAKMSKSHSGKPQSKETRNKRSKSHLERYANMTDKEKDKLSKRNSGKNNPMYGKAPWNKGLKLKKVCTNA